MSKKEAFFYHLGFFWCLPLSILTWLVFGVMYLFGQFEAVIWCRNLTMIWDAKNGSWLEKRALTGRGWAGFSFGCNMLVVDRDGFRWARTIKHETAHCMQQYKYGIFMPILYILITLWIYLFKKDLHSYYDHPFEVEARVAAGQLAKIPKELWKDGPNDRFAWF